LSDDLKISWAETAHDGKVLAISKAGIMAEIPKLSHQERREIMRLIFETERDADALAECDRLALERFQILDAMEAEDERRQNTTR
jgi:hypothetical protein